LIFSNEYALGSTIDWANDNGVRWGAQRAIFHVQMSNWSVAGVAMEKK